MNKIYIILFLIISISLAIYVSKKTIFSPLFISHPGPPCIGSWGCSGIPAIVSSGSEMKVECWFSDPSKLGSVNFEFSCPAPVNFKDSRSIEIKYYPEYDDYLGYVSYNIKIPSVNEDTRVTCTAILRDCIAYFGGNPSVQTYSFTITKPFVPIFGIDFHAIIDRILSIFRQSLKI